MLTQAAVCQAVSVRLTSVVIQLLRQEAGTVTAPTAPTGPTGPVAVQVVPAPRPDEPGEPAEPAGTPELTRRQTQILRLLAQGGLSNRQIARKLGISESTVKAHLHTIFIKLGARDRTDALVKALGVDQARLDRTRFRAG